MKLVLILLAFFGCTTELFAQQSKNLLIGMWKADQADQRQKTFNFIDSTQVTLELEPLLPVPMSYVVNEKNGLLVLRLTGITTLSNEPYTVTAVAKLIDSNSIKLQLFDDLLDHYQFEEGSKDGDPVIFKRVAR